MKENTIGFKCGDILFDNNTGMPFIFNGMVKDNHLYANGGLINTNKGIKYVVSDGLKFWAWEEYVRSATEEEKKLLTDKMIEAGFVTNNGFDNDFVAGDILVNPNTGLPFVFSGEVINDVMYSKCALIRDGNGYIKLFQSEESEAWCETKDVAKASKFDADWLKLYQSQEPKKKCCPKGSGKDLTIEALEMVLGYIAHNKFGKGDISLIETKGLIDKINSIISDVKAL